MPIHLYPSRLYTLHSTEIKELVTELNKEGYRVEEEKNREEEEKHIKLVKDSNRRILLVFIRVDQRHILHFIEVVALYENEYKRIIEKIKEKIKIYSLGWI
jgi:replication-associated recombination protein RarA